MPKPRAATGRRRSRRSGCPTSTSWRSRFNRAGISAGTATQGRAFSSSSPALRPITWLTTPLVHLRCFRPGRACSKQPATSTTSGTKAASLWCTSRSSSLRPGHHGGSTSRSPVTAPSDVRETEGEHRSPSVPKLSVCRPWRLPVPTYLVETYMPRSHAQEARAAGRRAQAAAEELSREGTPVCYVRTTFLPDDETCFHLFE